VNLFIYEIQIVKLMVANQLCLLEAESEIDDVGAGEQRWISNEVMLELVNNVVSAHEVGSSAAVLHCEESAYHRHSNIHRIISCHDD
jgi:hypothetical protein